MYPFHVCLTSFLRSKVVVFPSFFCCLPVLILSHVLPERVARRENRLCLLSLRQNKNSSFPGHAPGKDTLRAANTATKEGFTGRKRVKRKRLPVVVPVKIKIPVATADMRRHSDTLRGAQRRRKRGLRGENGLSEAITRCLPVLICLPVIKITNILSPVSIYRGQRIFRRALTRRSYRWKA